MKDDKLFLRRFKRHVELFLKSGRFTKKLILKNLDWGSCPFELEEYDPELGTRYVGLKKGFRKWIVVHRNDADPDYIWNMDYDRDHLREEMKKIVRGIKYENKV